MKRLIFLMQYVSTMPDISLEDINRALARAIPARPSHRSKGTHLTDVLQRMNRESGRMKEKIVFGRNTYAPLDEDDMPMCMALGMIFETGLMQLMPWLERIGEISKDGIAMSPDAGTYNCRRHLLSPDKDVPVVLDEIKLTWKSVNRGLEEHFNYLQQTKSYCYGLGTTYCRLHIMHVNGSYKFGDDPLGGPQYVQHHIQYSPFEIQMNWEEVQRRKKEYGL